MAARYPIWLTVKHATTIAIPGRVPKPWICRIADQMTAIPTLDAAITGHRNDVPRPKPIRALSASSRKTTVMWIPVSVQSTMFGALQSLLDSKAPMFTSRVHNQT